ncbi:hypothetical protein [Streptomyces millisiae]|uniref:DUF4325 domain-containing protein n=1 Tax=Streptomyces millisiae TaxID=3075542 RepID=A0ABU2LLV0_9ACTN|nr:hypothetical protein [Streptomyces sp. DSM 44918]MDT0318028.1 hypothetical protein [Streptomyces sp. DSM 44918]
MKPRKNGASLRFAVQDHGSFLFTRTSGITVRNALEAQVHEAAPVALLTIDFVGVDAMTNSFTDEFLGKFYLSLAAGDSDVQGVQLVGLSEETRDAVTVCLERRKQIAVDGDDGVLLGDAALLADTYEQARQLGRFRTTALADALRISLPNANNRLKRLVEAGALVRNRTAGPEGGGKEFVYSLPGAPGNE